MMNILYEIGCYEYLILVNKYISRDYFLNSVGAENGFSRKLFSELYDSIFAESIDICDMFKNYYKKEYKTLTDFLIKKYNFEKDVAEQINAKIYGIKGKPIYTLRTYKPLDYGDNGADSFLFGETIGDRIKKILLMEISDED
ncbi:MAG: hypothetical protein K6G31_05860 [Paludibacteraceae bacterium]|nr:hypothetical protein [Paludibacteraceae bacterium]